MQPWRRSGITLAVKTDEEKEGDDEAHLSPEEIVKKRAMAPRPGMMDESLCTDKTVSLLTKSQVKDLCECIKGLPKSLGRKCKGSCKEENVTPNFFFCIADAIQI